MDGPDEVDSLPSSPAWQASPQPQPDTSANDAYEHTRGYQPAMATATIPRAQATVSFPERSQKRKKEARTDIWSNLLRQTREAQARNRTQAVQHRQLIVCGGKPDDQQSFVQSLARPPPAQHPSRNQERRQQRPKGELRLSNRYAYGYGHTTLYSPPQQSGAGVQVLGAEAEEAARVEVHTLPDASEQYEGTLRRLLRGKAGADAASADGELLNSGNGERDEEERPGVCVLLSWKEPWNFLHQLKRWLQLLAKALLRPGVSATDPMEVIRDAHVGVAVVVQHTESQEDLLREGYKEEDFDYISQCLRSAILPLHPLTALVYMTSNAPPQQPGGALSELQKVVYSSLGLDLAILSPKQPRAGDSAQKLEIAPKHEFMDRMAIVIPAGWDSAAFIRTLSETFSPEDMLNSWLADLQPSPEEKAQPLAPPEETNPEDKEQSQGGAEVYESSPVDETPDDISEPPLSPTKAQPSAIRSYVTRIVDPQAHKQQRPPQIEVITKPDQQFLAEMREHLQQLEAQDRERDAGTRSGVSNTSLSQSRVVGVPAGEATGALTELGDVSFNVGGVSYDTVSAEAAIERLKRPPAQPSPLSPTGRTSTPKPSRSHKDGGEERGTPAGGREISSGSTKSSEGSGKDLPIDKLEEYFQSLMIKGGGGAAGSRDGTPSKAR